MSLDSNLLRGTSRLSRQSRVLWMLVLAPSVGLNVFFALRQDASSDVTPTATVNARRTGEHVRHEAGLSAESEDFAPVPGPQGASSDAECAARLQPLKAEIASSRRLLATWMQPDLLWREESVGNSEAPPPGVKDELASALNRIWPPEGDVVGFDLDCMQHVCRTSVMVRPDSKDLEAWYQSLLTDPKLSPMFQDMVLKSADKVVALNGDTLNRYTVFSKIPDATRPEGEP